MAKGVKRGKASKSDGGAAYVAEGLADPRIYDALGMRPKITK